MMSMTIGDETVQVHDAMWSQRVMLMSDKLHLQFPEALHGRIEAATAMARHLKRFRVTEGTWEVADLDAKQWFPVNGSCPCGDAEALEHWCKHRLAANIVRRAREIPEGDLVIDPVTYDQETGEIAEPDRAPDPGREEEHEDTPEQRYQLPARFFTLVQGVKCVKYTGLLRLAHQHGLLSLEGEWTHNEETLSLARAVAIFQDGRRFQESGDSTPTNAARVKDAWRRMSLTRAKARCLRDALSIDLCSVEEME